MFRLSTPQRSSQRPAANLSRLPATFKQRNHYELPRTHRHGLCTKHPQNTPAAFAAFAAFDDAALRHPDKVIPRKYTELMAIAVALTTQCVYCIDTHTATAKAEGATE